MVALPLVVALARREIQIPRQRRTGDERRAGQRIVLRQPVQASAVIQARQRQPVRRAHIRLPRAERDDEAAGYKVGRGGSQTQSAGENAKQQPRERYAEQNRPSFHDPLLYTLRYVVYYR